MKYNKLAASLFFAGMLLLSGCGTDDKENTTPPPADTASSSDTTAPASTNPVLESTNITTAGGKSIRVDKTANGLVFQGYEGKIVLLEIYGNTCPHCVEAIPLYNRLQAKYPNDVYVIAMESYGTLDSAGLQQFATTNGMQYDTVAMSNSGNMFSYMGSMTGYNVNQGVPALLILARNGDLAEYIPPSVPSEAYIDGVVQGLR